MRFLRVALVVAASTIVVTSVGGEPRTWKSASGTSQIEAELVRVQDDGAVLLKKADGSIVPVALEKLSAADRLYVNQLESSPARPAAPAKIPREVASSDVEREAQKCTTAKAALLVYTLYLANPKVSAEERNRAQGRIAFWEEQAAKNYVRLGREWMTTEDAAQTRKRASELVDQAIRLVQQKQDGIAEKNLKDASRLDPESIEADFIFGLLCALIGHNHEMASDHFRECLKRDPNNISALNNLALAEVRLQQYASALNHWKAAVKIAPRTAEIAHNVGRFLKLAAERKLPAKFSDTAAMNRLYANILAQGGKSEMGGGWLYLLPYGSKWNGSANAADSIITGGGSGFVVDPQYVLTNRHVVEDAGGLAIMVPQSEKREPLLATLVAVSNEADLALLRCDQLKAPPLKLQPRMPGHGANVMLLGFPEMYDLGTTTKSTRGAIVALPDAATNQQCLYDAVTNPGHSGGPVCDNTGSVVAVHCASYNFGGKLGAGIPAASALALLKQSIAGFSSPAPLSQSLEWPDVDGAVSPSTVLVLRQETRPRDVGLSVRIGSSDFLEDRNCMVCDGAGKIKCPVRTCSRGTVPVIVEVVKGRNPVNGQEVITKEKKRATCDFCRGQAFVRCEACNGGIDRDLR